MSWPLSATSGARIAAEDIGDGVPVPPRQTRKVFHVIPVGEKGGLETALLNLLGAADPARWQGMVLRLLSAPGLGIRMGQIGQRRVDAHFSSTTLARRVDALYDKLAVERGRRA